MVIFILVKPGGTVFNLVESLEMSVVLLGDSVFKRLFEKHPDRFCSLSRMFCVSGQTSGDLKSLVKENRDLLRGRSVVLHIGTNDFLKSVDLSILCHTAKSIVRILRKLSCSVRVVEIIPIGRWGVSAEAQQAICKFNNFLRSFRSSGVLVSDAFTAFCSSSEVDLSLYCAVIGKYRRVDRVHPNNRGLDVLMSIVCLPS